MPIYEYYCADCGNAFEVMRSMTEADEPINCRNCQGEHTSRKISLFASHSTGSNGGSVGSTMPSSGGCAGCSASSCAGCR